MRLRGTGLRQITSVVSVALITRCCSLTSSSRDTEPSKKINIPAAEAPVEPANFDLEPFINQPLQLESSKLFSRCSPVNPVNYDAKIWQRSTNEYTCGF